MSHRAKKSRPLRLQQLLEAVTRLDEGSNGKPAEHIVMRHIIALKSNVVVHIASPWHLKHLPKSGFYYEVSGGWHNQAIRSKARYKVQHLSQIELKRSNDSNAAADSIYTTCNTPDSLHVEHVAHHVLCSLGSSSIGRPHHNVLCAAVQGQQHLVGSEAGVVEA